MWLDAPAPRRSSGPAALLPRVVALSVLVWWFIAVAGCAAGLPETQNFPCTSLTLTPPGTPPHLPPANPSQ
ncbi:MAG: hypothetical protein FJ135_02455 [Deltaproteobacteria bacterium]|nr:hypothetical protein [Deltaproteobacteria bacterium]